MRSNTHCGAKLQYIYKQGLEVRGYPAHRSRVVGSTTHEIVEGIYRSTADVMIDEMAPMHDGIKRGMEYFDGVIPGYRDYNDTFKRIPPEELEFMIKFDKMLVEVFAEIYHKYIFMTENFEIQLTDENEEMIEKSLMAATITPGGRASPRYYYAGKMDWVFFNPSDKYVYLGELKTKAKSFWTEKLQMGLKYDEQITGYLWLIRQQPWGKKLNINRIIYTVLLKPALRLKKNETQDEFIDRCRETMLANPEDYYDRKIIYRSDKEIDEFGKRAYVDSVRIKEMMDEPDPRMLMNPGYSGENCVKFQRPCDFYDLCSSHARPADLHERFIVKGHAHQELDMDLEEA